MFHESAGRHVTLDELNAEWERVQDTLPDDLALRMRRALSWLERAEKEADDDDAAFTFYQIAFNAALSSTGSGQTPRKDQEGTP